MQKVITNRFLYILNLILFLHTIYQYGLTQEHDCYFAKSEPIVFIQDTIYAQMAKSIITDFKNSSDTLTLIGVSKKELLVDLSCMIENPNSTTLNDSGYYCGVVVVLNWMLNNRPDLYAKGVIGLAINGEVEFVAGNKRIKLPRALKNNVDYSIINSEKEIIRSDIGKISISDFILGVSLVHSEKVLQRTGLLWKKSTHCKSNVGNFIFANTMPWELDDYFKAIGITNVISKYYSPFENQDKILQYIFHAVENGEMPILMENHLLTADRHKNLFYKIFGAHFISVHGFKINNDCNTISLAYWDYGSVKNHREQSVKGSPLAARTLSAAIIKNNRLNKIKKDDKYLEITRELFFKGLKGYWIPSITTPIIKYR